MKRTLGTLLMLLSLAAAARAQDAVKLKNGKYVAGAVTIDEADKEGFKVERWDTGAIVQIRWNQITEAERNRLLNKPPVETAPAGDLIDGLQVITTTREVIGVRVKEDANQILIKTKDSVTPVAVPKSAILRREDQKVREAEAYSAREMVDARAAKADAKSYDAMHALGTFASGLKLYDRAKEFYLKAGDADASKKETLDKLIAENDRLIQEAKALALLDQIKKLVEETEFAKAIDLSKELLAEHPESDAARQNKDLVAALTKQAKDYELHRAEILAQQIPDMFKSKRQALFSQYSNSSKFKLVEARAEVGRLDELILNDLAKKKKATTDEIRQAWDKREQKPKTTTYGDGSWIVKGGQDGGLDYDGKADAQQEKPPTPQDDFFNRRFGGNNKKKPPPKPQELGQKLQTSEEWWSSASQSERKGWLESEYAMNSSCAKKIEEKLKKCSNCKGEGTLRSVRGGKAVDVKCPRCHGAKEDVGVVYY